MKKLIFAFISLLTSSWISSKAWGIHRYGQIIHELESSNLISPAFAFAYFSPVGEQLKNKQFSLATRKRVFALLLWHYKVQTSHLLPPRTSQYLSKCYSDEDIHLAYQHTDHISVDRFCRLITSTCLIVTNK